MQITTEFGLGEIVTTHQKRRGGDQIIPDLIGEVIAIVVAKPATVYHVRLTNGMIQPYDECDLVGDPDYDQDAGRYPDGHD